MNNWAKASPQFKSIKDTRLKTLNRCVIAINLVLDRGYSAAKSYVENFGEEEGARINRVLSLVEQYGQEALRKRCTPSDLEPMRKL